MPSTAGCVIYLFGFVAFGVAFCDASPVDVDAIVRWWPQLPTPSWGPCSFPAAPNVRCANVTVPRNWEHPNEGNVFVSVSLSKATTATGPTGTVWFLNGGSAVASECMAGSSLVNYYNSQGLDVGLPDIRGAGLSVPRLFCPGDPNGTNVPSVACAQHFNETFGAAGMYNYSITMASHDLAFVIALLSETANNFIEGDSFGTFWGQRFLSIYPTAVTAAVIESYGVPNRWNYFEAMDNIDWSVRRTLQYCSLDPVCNEHVGAGMDAYALAATILRRASNGSLPCSQRLPPSMAPTDLVFSNMLGLLAGTGSRDTYAFLPALLYRWARCNDDDVAALEFFFNNFLANEGSSSARSKRWMAHRLSPSRLTSSRRDFASGKQLAAERDGPGACDISEVVLYGLFFSEGVQMLPPPSVSVLLEHLSTLTAKIPADIIASQRELYDVWPRYPWDPFVHQYPNTSVPILFMSGDLDISTPFDNAAFSLQYYNKSQQYFVHMPMCPHVAFLQSPQFGSPVPCGVEVVITFFVSNGTVVNRTCVNNIIPLDFMNRASDPAVAEYFGTPDLWQYDGPQPLWPN